MKKLFGYAFVFVAVVALILGIYWGIWTAWCWALPQLYPTGPQGLIAPSYWLFVVCLFGILWLGNLLRGK